MTSIESHQRPDYKTVVVGNGPASIGIFVAAARIGRLQELLDGGVAVIGNTETIGSGKLGKYKINSNSPGGDFLEPFNEAQDSAFDDVLHTKEAEELKSSAERSLPLVAIGKFIDRIGERVQHLLESNRQCRFYENEKVDYVDDLGRSFLAYFEGFPGAVSGRSLVLATGGNARSSDCQNWDADEALINPEECFPDIETDDTYEIIGGSHSAFSIAHTLLQQSDSVRRQIQIQILHRSPIRLFYDLTKEQPPDWYKFDKQNDVCPATKRLHRFGGLRGDSRELYLRICNRTESRVKLNHVPAGIRDCDRDNEFASFCDATGYTTNLVTFHDYNNEEIPLDISSDGQVNVNEHGQIQAENEELIPRLYGIGLGYGIRPNGIGEPSFRGRLDGVNVYWGPVGESIVRSILDRRSESATALSFTQ